jgi:hypothetical protein
MADSVGIQRARIRRLKQRYLPDTRLFTWEPKTRRTATYIAPLSYYEPTVMPENETGSQKEPDRNKNRRDETEDTY